MDCSGFWEELVGVSYFGLGDASRANGMHCCCCLQFLNDVVVTDDSVLIKARIDDEAQPLCAQTGPPAVGRPPSDSIGGRLFSGRLFRTTKFFCAEVLLRHVDKVKVLQAFVRSQDGVAFLDATGVPIFYAGHVAAQQPEALQVAEIFAGSFAAWSRAASSLRDGGLPIHVSWLLERDPDCWAYLSVLDSDLVTVSAPADIPSASQHPGTILLSTDFRDEWWHRLTHMRPVDLAVVSLPVNRGVLLASLRGYSG